MRKVRNLKTETDRSPNSHGQNHVKYGLERGKNESDRSIEDIKHILAITDGQFGKPVTRSGRFINANHPPKDATKEELETIARFWGDPDDVEPLSEAELYVCKKVSDKKRKPC